MRLQDMSATLKGSLYTGLALALLCLAVDARAQQSACIPSGQPAAPAAGRAGRGPAAPPAPRTSTIAGIPGVVAADAKWTKIWQQAGNSADGVVADKDGGALVAQEDYDTVLKIDANGRTSVSIADAKGIGSVSIDRQGRIYGAHRTERPGSTKPDRDAIVNAITILSPARSIVADKWADGTPLSVRPNDLAADGNGGAYFTSGCLFYARNGTASVAGEDLRTNGIVFSTDDKTLYVTNGTGIVAFDVVGPGKLANRRDFAMLPAGNGDGMAMDTEDRLYVTANAGVYVFDKRGAVLGLIPTPRAVISVGFAGPGKKTLYVVGSGADDANGNPIREGPQQTAATVYTLPMIAQGVQGRGK